MRSSNSLNNINTLTRWTTHTHIHKARDHPAQKQHQPL